MKYSISEGLKINHESSNGALYERKAGLNVDFEDDRNCKKRISSFWRSAVSD